MVRIIHAVIAAVASASIDIEAPCLDPELASLPECEEANKLEEQIRMTKSLFDRLNSSHELDTHTDIKLNPVDGILMDSFIDRAMIDLDEGEEMLKTLFSTSEFSPKFVKAVFDRRIKYLELEVKTQTQLAIDRASEHTVQKFEALEQELSEINARRDAVHAEVRNRLDTRFDPIKRWIRKYRHARSFGQSKYFAKFGEFKRLLDEKIESIFDISEPAAIVEKQREVLNFLVSLEKKGMSYISLWSLCRESYHRMSEVPSVLSEETTAEITRLEARHMEISSQLNLLRDSYEKAREHQMHSRGNI